MSEHVPVAQPASGIAEDGLEGWRRSLPWWDWYFGTVTVGTILFAFDWRAVAVLVLMALWYAAFGRRVCRVPLPLWQPVLYLAVGTVLLTVAVTFASGASFILFALSPQAHMMLSFGWAMLASIVMNLVPTAVLFAREGTVLPTLPIGILAIVLTAMVGYSIDRLIQQSIELAQSRAEVARLSREAERRRLGADLHDTIAQGLSSVLMLVQAADAALDRDNPDRDNPDRDRSEARRHLDRDTAEARRHPDRDTAEARRHLDLAARTARENLREIRAVLDALMPTEQDLPEALRRLTNRFTEETGLDAHLGIVGNPRPLEIAAEVVLLRAAQESLSNVRRHAQARSVEMSLRFDPEAVHLEVRDDGRGFKPSRTIGGYGLEAMRSRVTQAGGSIEIDPTPSGTSIRVVVPA